MRGNLFKETWFGLAKWLTWTPHHLAMVHDLNACDSVTDAWCSLRDVIVSSLPNHFKHWTEKNHEMTGFHWSLVRSALFVVLRGSCHTTVHKEQSVTYYYHCWGYSIANSYLWFLNVVFQFEHGKFWNVYKLNMLKWVHVFGTRVKELLADFGHICLSVCLIERKNLTTMT